jgi:hypothetical protein
LWFRRAELLPKSSAFDTYPQIHSSLILLRR